VDDVTYLHAAGTRSSSAAISRPDGSASVAGCGAGSYTQNFAGAGTTDPTTNPNSTAYAWFVQDELRIRTNLTLSFGLRYDLMTNAKPSIVNPDPQLVALGVNTGQMKTDKNNFGPRVGFAKFPPPDGCARSYGIYYARTILIATATSNNGLQVISGTIPGNLPPSFR
jgi:outer membrane receptor protein involved in Fe transport